jgi:hypothetical protein
MNAIGQLILFIFTGGAYLLLFATIAPLIAKIFLKIHYTGYWYPIIVALTLVMLFIIHKQVSLLGVLIFAQIIFSAGILEGKLF